MKDLSIVASAVKASTTLAVDSLAKQMKADGMDVIGFGTGEPDFDTPDNIKQAAYSAIKRGETKYTPAAGIVPLRQAVCRRLYTDLGVEYTPEQITIASGAKHSVYIALRAIINPGDEVILPAPYWLTYYEAIVIAGGVPVVLDTTEETGFKINPHQLKQAITPKTKAFLINNPSNPTGMLYTGDELKPLVDICCENDLYIISDEIYYALVYDNKDFTSVISFGQEVRDRTILINGASKTYAMTGWRIGYAAANQKISKVMANYLSHSTGAPATMAQFAAVEAFDGPQDSVAEMREVFDQRRRYIVERINSMDSVSCLMPDAAFYVMMNITKQKGRTLGGRLINDGDDFAIAFLESAMVAAVACSGFGAPDFLRFTYATGMENIRRGMDRLEEFLKG